MNNENDMINFFSPREVIKAGIKENKLEKNKTRGRDH